MTTEFAPQPEMDEETDRLYQEEFKKLEAKGGISSLFTTRTKYPLNVNPGIESRLPTFYEIGKLEIKVEWVVQGVIPKEAIILLTAPGGGLKTMLCLKMGSCVSNGSPFLGQPTTKMPAYFVDYENPLSLLSDRARLLGGSEMLIWHLSNLFSPPRLDVDDWILFKALKPGLLIFDTLRSAQLLDENSSRDMALIMGRLKELREMGFTILLIHHSPKADDRKYKGSSAISDLADHCLVLERVRAVGSDETADDQDDSDLPLRLGVRGKTRFESTPVFLDFNDEGFRRANDPNENLLSDMQSILKEYHVENGNYPNQTHFLDAGKSSLGLSKKSLRRLLQKGLGKYWELTKGPKNSSLYQPIQFFPHKKENQDLVFPLADKSNDSNESENTELFSFSDGVGKTGKTASNPVIQFSPPLIEGENRKTEEQASLIEENDEGE